MKSDCPVPRRALLFAALGFSGGVACNESRGSNSAPVKSSENAPRSKPASVNLVEFDASGARKGAVTADKVVKSDAEWKQQLTQAQFVVTRKKGTEPAYSGEYHKLHDKGIYRCICCGNALFSSETKFESGTGWPSFWAPIAEENIENEKDTAYGMVRTEVRCRKCDAHLGHVFEDGPPPTNLRYCMNSLALDFKKSE